MPARTITMKIICVARLRQKISHHWPFELRRVPREPTFYYTARSRWSRASVHQILLAQAGRADRSADPSRDDDIVPVAC